jgi:hypothetical protein
MAAPTPKPQSKSKRPRRLPSTPCSAFAGAAKDVYDAATALWFAAKVERHAEGHPGVPGPSGDGESWDMDRAYIEGAIDTLEEIHQRLYGQNAERIHGGAGQSKQSETPTPLDGASC